jgi:hypothetical protein
MKAAWLLAVCLAATPSIAQVCTPYVEEHPASTAATFRPHASVFQACEVNEETYRQVIRDWLRTRSSGSAPLSSLSLGRAEAFPWISRYLADAALGRPQWVRRVARGSSGEHNRFVADLLSEPAFLKRLDQPFDAAPYRVVGVSVEKVLIGKAGEHASAAASPAAPVPFDAQLWLRLAPRQ